jgi:U6 snRNA-associated Sm-like protein LSm4
MVLPSMLLQSARKAPILIELKNGEAYNGTLVNCDQWMNICLSDVICTAPDGDRFWKLSECFIRGTTVKYIRIPDEVMEKSRAEQQRSAKKAAETPRPGASSHRGPRSEQRE